MTVQITTLDNGLRVTTDPMDGVESVSLGVWIGVGTRNELEEHNGVAHLVEHMLFKGTERRSAFDISAQMEDVGAHMNAYTTREVTAYHAKVLKQDVALAADIICDMMQHAQLDIGELEKERGVIIQEIGQSMDQPDDVIFDHVQAKTYPGCGLGRPILGTVDLIKSMPRQAMLDYIQTNYAAPHMVLAAAGAVSHDQMVDLANRFCKKLPREAKIHRDGAKFHSGDVREAREIEQLHALISFNGVSYHATDYFTMSVLSTLLGGGMSSRLFQEVREKRGLVYSIYSFVSAYSDAGQFGIYAGTDPARVGELLPVIAEQMQLLMQEVTEEELKRAKTQLRASLFMAQESTMARAEKLAYNQLMYNRRIENAEIIEKIEKVTAADIKRMTRQLLSAAPVTGFIGPLHNVPDGDVIAKRFAV